ncbi:MAG: cbb3-type cytochrome c oxidase N-terminal domain-containing protein [Bacteroidota bacterium]|nr:cbb3-type cytochrome c oxidase N-terminal domain-containing protein [Bacteroidota bacterium]
MRNYLKYISGLIAILLVCIAQPAYAGGPPAPSIFSNPLAVTFITLMLLLLIVIGILANVVIGAADVKLKKRIEEKARKSVIVLLLLMLFNPASVLAQATTDTVTKTSKLIGGMDASTFYVMVTVLFLELLVIIVLLLNIKLLLKKEKEKTVTEKELAVTAEEKVNKLSWWDKINKLRPVSQEAELDLGHEYDGIRELNNKLPPWWLYGFYATILFAVIYLWRFEVSHKGPSSKEEYEMSVAKAEIKIQEYLKKKGDLVDENTVTLLTGADDIAAGKALFMDPSKCPACHNADGGGNAVGPNLTDDYWVYGGNVKDIFKTIKYGTSKGMRSWKDDLSAKQIAQLTSYIKTLKGSKPVNPKEQQGELYKEEAVPKIPADSATTASAGNK